MNRFRIEDELFEPQPSLGERALSATGRFFKGFFFGIAVIAILIIIF